MTGPSTPVIWIDASRGAAGDMLLAALLDAGADLDRVTRVVQAAAVACGEPIELRVEPVRRHGLRASRLVVDSAASSTERHLSDLLSILAATAAAQPSALPARAVAFAEETLRRLAEAEGRVHGIEADAVHFHEVGALDSIADILGCAAALDDLGLLADAAVRVVSEVALGGGSARTAHGVIPVPVPATLALLTGAPVTAGAGDRELCTPTGAALLAALATGWGALPPMTIKASGSGAGSYDPVDRPNITRVVVGTNVVAERSWQRRDLTMLEATVDDLDPRLWPAVLEALHDAGAADAWLTPVLMRHGRPGQVLSALLPPDVVDGAFAVLARYGVSLGARLHAVERRSLPRDSITVLVAGLPVQVKRAVLDGQVLTIAPEFSDAQEVARRSGLSVAEVIERARGEARSMTPPDD